MLSQLNLEGKEKLIYRGVRVDCNRNCVSDYLRC